MQATQSPHAPHMALCTASLPHHSPCLVAGHQQPDLGLQHLTRHERWLPGLRRRALACNQYPPWLRAAILLCFAGRQKPGLSPQHLTGLRLVEQVSSGRLAGCAVRSQAISFVPGPLMAGSYLADTHTAGSCTLMVQQALPCLLFAEAAAAGAG